MELMKKKMVFFYMGQVYKSRWKLVDLLEGIIILLMTNDINIQNKK